MHLINSNSTFYWRWRLVRFGISLFVVGIISYALDDRGSTVRFPAGPGNFSLHHHGQNGSRSHPVSYPMGTRCCFPGVKAAGAWNWPLTSIQCRSQECVEIYLHSPNTSSWRGALLSTGTILPFYLYYYYYSLVFDVFCVWKSQWSEVILNGDVHGLFWGAVLAVT
jgi:hypothetical protein